MVQAQRPQVHLPRRLHHLGTPDKQVPHTIQEVLRQWDHLRRVATTILLMLVTGSKLDQHTRPQGCLGMRHKPTILHQCKWLQERWILSHMARVAAMMAPTVAMVLQRVRYGTLRHILDLIIQAMLIPRIRMLLEVTMLHLLKPTDTVAIQVSLSVQIHTVPTDMVHQLHMPPLLLPLP